MNRTYNEMYFFLDIKLYHIKVVVVLLSLRICLSSRETRLFENWANSFELRLWVSATSSNELAHVSRNEKQTQSFGEKSPSPIRECKQKFDGSIKYPRLYFTCVPFINYLRFL